MALNISSIAAFFTAASLGGLTLTAAPATYSGDENANDDRIEVGSRPDDGDDGGSKGERKLPPKVSPDDVEAALAAAQADLSPDQYARFQRIAEHAGPLAAMRAVMKWKHHDHANTDHERGKRDEAEKGKKPAKRVERDEREKPEQAKKGLDRERPDKRERPDRRAKSERHGKPGKSGDKGKQERGPGQRDMH